VFWALKDVSFEVGKGEMVGLVGDNGSGKSTILKLLTGISKPTHGEIKLNGRISALLELGAGFHPDFTGRENVFLNASILGLRRKEIEVRFDDIVNFAELGEFIDNPVKTYSSGMYMRLAFAIAVNVDPDILVIDEVLAVGDAPFQRKCFEQIKRFRKEGKTILLVTHDLSAVRDLCDRAIWLQKGKLMADGPPEKVIELYRKRVTAEDLANPQAGLSPVRISDVFLQGSHEHEPGIWAHKSSYRVGFDLAVAGPSEGLALNIKIIKSDGVCCYTSNHAIGSSVPPLSRVEIEIPAMPLLTGSYTLEVNGVAGPIYLETRKHFFHVSSSVAGEGIAPLPCTWGFAPSLVGETSAVHPL
jgi:ABC-type polysaccharide/polyol phosphate transport system ATPase subunit